MSYHDTELRVNNRKGNAQKCFEIKDQPTPYKRERALKLDEDITQYEKQRKK